MIRNKREIINELLIFIVGLIIAIAAIVTDDGSVDSWAMKDRYDTPLDLLRDVWNNPKAPKGIRYQAAKDALPYVHARMEVGKKEEKEKAAKRAVRGKFQPGAKPSMYQ